MVWRHHKEVTSKIEIELEKEEKEVPLSALWPGVAPLEWIVPQEPIEEHAGVSIDGAMILIRDEGYREVKIVSISEVVTAPEEKDALPISEMAAGHEGDRNRDKKEERGRQDELKLLNHSYRAILGDKMAFAPALKGELARRRVNEAAQVSTVNDGAGWIWGLVDAFLPEKRAEILDWCHALENLAKAGKAAFGEGSQEARTWLEKCENELWNGERMKVENSLHDLPRRYKENGKTIRQVKGYIDEHWHRIEYARFRAEGRPIGSGTVESGAKNVVQWRMKRGGQRWCRSGATRMLAALGEVHSNRWDSALQRLDKAA